jgi:predicted Zn-dependent protease
VLPPSAVADLLIYAYWSSDARSAHEGRSVYSRPGGGTRVGDQLTDVPLTLFSDPAYPGLAAATHVVARSSWPFASVFDNGLPTPAQTWLDRGRLAALPTTRHTAALSGLPVTPPVDNLVLTGEGGAGTALDLCAGLGHGLLLTSLWYIREVDPMTLLLTGLTRDGVYLVEGGEVAGAVGNFRFNDSPVDLLRRVRAVGGTEITLSREWSENFPRTAMAPLLVEGFSFTGSSEAS